MVIIDRRLPIWFPFPDGSKDILMATNFRVKIDYSPLFVAMAFRNVLYYCHFDFKKFICHYLATLCENSVNFGSVTPEFTKVQDVHPSFLSLK